MVLQASVVLNKTIVRHNDLTNQLIIYVVVLVNACQLSRDVIGLMKVTNGTTHIKNVSHCQQWPCYSRLHPPGLSDAPCRTGLSMLSICCNSP